MRPDKLVAFRAQLLLHGGYFLCACTQFGLTGLVHALFLLKLVDDRLEPHVIFVDIPLCTRYDSVGKSEPTADRKRVARARRADQETIGGTQCPRIKFDAGIHNALSAVSICLERGVMRRCNHTDAAL